MTSQVHIVTTFSPEGFQLYGNKFIDSFKSDDVSLFVGVEDAIDKYPKKEKVTYLNISRSLSEFLFNNYVSKIDPNLSELYLFHAHKFCFKTLILNNPHLPADGLRVWIDGDVFFKSKINKDFILNLIQDNDLVYLGREYWHHSECGFLIFRLNEFGKSFLARWHWFYTSGRFASLVEWHDSYLFDFVLREFGNKNIKNITENIRDKDVFNNHSILSKYMTHNKGNLKY